MCSSLSNYAQMDYTFTYAMRLFENSPVVWGTPSCRFPLFKGEPIFLNWFPLLAGGT